MGDADAADADAADAAPAAPSSGLVPRPPIEGERRRGCVSLASRILPALPLSHPLPFPSVFEVASGTLDAPAYNTWVFVAAIMVVICAIAEQVRLFV